MPTTYKSIISIFFILLLLSCEKRMFNNFGDAKVYFDGVFNGKGGPSGYLDDYGNVSILGMTASEGMVELRLSDVHITMEERKEEAGCADVCPPMVIIYFKCEKGECVSIPSADSKTWNETIASLKFDEGSISFTDIEKGKRAYKLLLEIQRFI